MLPLPFCIKPDKLIAVDNLNLRIDCPPLNRVIQRGPRSQIQSFVQLTKLFFIYFLSAIISELSTMLQISPCSM